MNKILVSVIMITYGHEEYIEEAINGVLMQECDFDVELIIADDFSSDKTEIIVNNIIADQPKANIKFTRHSSNKGMQQNFIWAYQQSSGKYIALCEGDDYWIDPLKLKKQVEFLEKNNQYAICFTYSKRRVGGMVEKEEKSIEPLEYNQYDFLTGKKYQTRTCTSLLRNNKIVATSPYVAAANAVDTWIKILSTKNSLAKVLPFYSAVYRIHKGGVWSSLTAKLMNKKKLHDLFLKWKYAKENNRNALPLIGISIIKCFMIDLLKR